MPNNLKPGGLHDLTYYLRHAAKFYTLNNTFLTPVLFVITLALNFLPTLYLIYTNADNSLEKIPIQLVLLLFGSVALSEYLYALYTKIYIAQLIGNNEIFIKSFFAFLKNTLHIILGFIVFIIALSFGFILFIIPGFILYTTFVFYNCYVVDKNMTFFQSFNASRRATLGKRMNIFIILTAYFIVFYIPVFLLSMNELTLINGFIGSFGSVIIGFILKRLIALMYVDLQYGFTQDDADE